jgi:hypothetical protein
MKDEEGIEYANQSRIAGETPGFAVGQGSNP